MCQYNFKMCVARILVTSIYLVSLTWQHTPVSAGYQYSIFAKNGIYKYGNQVSGRYRYRNDLGNFGIEHSFHQDGDRNDPTFAIFHQQNPNVNKAYHFSIDTDNYKKEEFSDPDGNIRGYFAYEDNAGHHDLSYVANDKTGYRVTGGNLAINTPVYLPPFRIENEGPSIYRMGNNYRSIVSFDHYDSTTNPYSDSERFTFPFNSVWDYQRQFLSNVKNQLFLTPYYLIDLPNYFGYWPYYNGTNRSYKFSFDTGNYKKEESSDRYGNVRGCFEYYDNAGPHDLTYISNDQTGFRVTGGNLAAYFPTYHQRPEVSSHRTLNINKNAASGQLEYPFSYTQNPRNQNLPRNFGNHLQGLSTYLNNLLTSLYNLPYSERRQRYYYFLFDTGKYKIEEASNAKGDIRGYFQYDDISGHYDLSYIIDNETGFQVDGGNLATNVARDLPTFTTNISGGIASNRTGDDENKPNNEDNEDEIIFQTGKATERPEDLN